MKLCLYNPLLLYHEWAVELIQQLSGKVNNDCDNALMLFLEGNTEIIDFGSRGFKLLWEKEKYIEIDKLKNKIRDKPELKERIVAVVSDAIEYFE